MELEGGGDGDGDGDGDGASEERRVYEYLRGVREREREADR